MKFHTENLQTETADLRIGICHDPLNYRRTREIGCDQCPFYIKGQIKGGNLKYSSACLLRCFELTLLSPAMPPLNPSVAFTRAKDLFSTYADDP